MQWTQSHLFKEDKFWQREFICSQDLFTGNNFGFSFSSSLSLSTVFPLLPPAVSDFPLRVLSCRFCAGSARSIAANERRLYEGVSCFPSQEQAALIWSNGYWLGHWFIELVISALYQHPQRRGGRERKCRKWKTGVEEEEGGGRCVRLFVVDVGGW